MTVARSRAHSSSKRTLSEMMYLPHDVFSTRAGGASRMAASTPSIGRGSTGSTRCGKLRSATGNSSLEFSSYRIVGLAHTCRAA